MPFTQQQFFEAFRDYNEAIWPAQALLFLLAILAVIGALWRRRGVAPILAALWAWCGIAYHWGHFARVNKAAWVFGALFLVAAGLILKNGGMFRFDDDAPPLRRWAGLGFIIYALLVYPAFGAAVGHLYPFAPTFGAPCPLTIFTCGLLLMAARRIVPAAAAVPLIWAAIASTAILRFGMIEDAGMPVAAATLAAFMFRERSRQSAPAAPYPFASAPPHAASP